MPFEIFKIEDGSIFSTAEVLEDIYGDTNEEVALVRKTTAYFEQARRHMPHIPAESLTLLQMEHQPVYLLIQLVNIYQLI